MHAEPHKRKNGDCSSQDRLDSSDFLKLINKHGRCGNVLLGVKKHNAEKLNTILFFSVNGSITIIHV